LSSAAAFVATASALAFSSSVPLVSRKERSQLVLLHFPPAIVLPPDEFLVRSDHPVSRELLDELEAADGVAYVSLSQREVDESEI